MYKNILIPTDGSALSLIAVTTGITLAKLLNAKVTGITVVQPFLDYAVGEFGLASDPGDLAKANKINATNASKYLDAITNQAKSVGVESSMLLIKQENPWEAIIATAASINADLIVMASHGRRGFDALVLGSETNKVLTHSKVPVLVTRQ